MLIGACESNVAPRCYAPIRVSWLGLDTRLSGLWFVLVCFVLAGVLFAISTVMADFCAAPTSSIAELVDAAPVTYYLECHTYTDTRLREDFPFNSLAVEIQEAFVDLDTISDNIDDNLRNLGASQSLLTQSAMLSLSVQLLGHGLSNDV